MSGFATTISPPSAPSNIAQWFVTQTEHVLSSAVNAPMQKLAEALMPLITVALTLQFLAYSYALMKGEGGMTITEFVAKAIRVAIISMVFGTAGLYQTSIASAMISLPDDMTMLVMDTKGVAAEIDKMQAETKRASDAMIGKSKGSWFSFLPSGREVLVGFLALMVRADSALIGSVIMLLLIVCKVGMALVVVCGPIFIAALLFEPTKKLFDSWVSQALNFIILSMLAGLIFSFLLQMNLQLIKMIATNVESGLTDILGLLSAQMMVGLASIIIMIMVPGLASGLSGGFGAQLGIGSAASGGFNALRLRSLTQGLRGGGAGGKRR